MRILAVTTVLLLANVLLTEGATATFNIQDKLKSIKDALTSSGKGDKPTLRQIDLGTEEGSALSKQIESTLNEAAAGDSSSTGRFFMKKMFLLGGKGGNQQPTILVFPVQTIPNYPDYSTYTYPSDVTQDATIDFGDNTIELEPVDPADPGAGGGGAGRKSDAFEVEDDIEEEDEEKNIGETDRAVRRRPGSYSNKKGGKGSSGIRIKIPKQYRKYFNNQNTFTVPSRLLNPSKKSSRRPSVSGTIRKRRIVRRRPVRKN